MYGSKNLVRHGDDPQGRSHMYGKPSETIRSIPIMMLDAQWITGFTDGEGCFHISINSHAEMSVGYQVLPEFTVVQHKKDIQVLHALKKYFKCGVVRTNHGDRYAYRVRGIEHLSSIIIPFFEKHSLKTKKNLDFLAFRDVLQSIKQKKHLTKEGIKSIKNIVKTMNRNRK